MMRIAIIGSGLSGLTLAHLLNDHAEVTLFDKARGVSGRMSTRRAELYRFDHGAQYFTARTEPFQSFLLPLIKSGLIKRWDARYVKFKRGEIIERRDWAKEEPRYVGVPGMNCFTKKLAEGQLIHLNSKIISLKRAGGVWHLSTEEGSIYSGYDWVISTIPSHQSVEILPSSFNGYHQIQEIEMNPCFSLMLGFSEKCEMKFDAAHVTHSDVSWIGVNSSKPDREDPFTIVVHSSEAFAKANLLDDREKISSSLCDETSRIIGFDVNIADFKAVHGWHFANNVNHDIDSVFLDKDLHLAACGDWCQGGRVEGAFTSAFNLANVMKNHVFNDC